MRRIAWIGRYRGYSGFAQATRRYVASLLPLIDNLIIAPLEVLENSDPYQPLVGDIEDSDFKLVNHLPTTDPEANAYLSVYEFDRIPEESDSDLKSSPIDFNPKPFLPRIICQIN